MRASLIGTLVFIGLIALGLRTTHQVHTSPRARAQDRVVIIEQGNANAVVSTNKRDRKQSGLPVWKDSVSGEFKSSSPEATEDAMRVAAERVARHLRAQTPPVEWTPTPEFVRKHMVKNVKEEQRELTDSNAPLTYRATVEFEMSDSSFQKILDEDRKYHVEQRMWWLARIVAGIVLMLVAVAGYVRLDDVTKGFYSIPLRIVALIVGLIGAAVVAVSVF
jgi:hypothetical protein